MNNEVDYLLVARWENSSKPKINFNRSEMSEVKWVPYFSILEEIDLLQKNGDEIAPWFEKMLNETSLLDYIEKM